ncbi:hypothetical protein [uncultured Duncaniella sp.]|uniref:hypothetical protein n=1 Tax=uncultured Duncaniella sp. TaxID=2768039 RepID=UPI0025F38957|nr:hypothetical protein [uncultured Duncaniella sp.]
MKQLLRNIVKVSYIDARILQDITVIPGMGIFLGDDFNFIPLKLVGLGGCEISSVTEDRVPVFTSVLTCLLSEDFDPANRPLAFLMTTLQGERFLLGTSEPPFPIVTSVSSLPAKMSEPSGYRLTAQWSSTLGLLRILD